MNNKTKILKYKKSETQFAYEEKNIIQPIKEKVPKAKSPGGCTQCHMQ